MSNGVRCAAIREGQVREHRISILVRDFGEVGSSSKGRVLSAFLIMQVGVAFRSVGAGINDC